MITVERIAGKLAESIYRNSPDPSSVAVLRYALIAVINLLITFLLVLVIAAITGDLKSAIIAMVAFPALRYVSGGLHLESSNLCNILTASFMLASIYIPVEYWYNGLVLNVITILILLLFAPSNIKRSKLDKKYYPILKLIAILIVCSNFIFQSSVLTIVLLIQSLTTTPLFQKLIDKIESRSKEVNRE